MKQLTQRITIIAVIILVSSISIFAQGGDRIIGKWKDAEHPEKQVGIIKTNNKYYGKSIAVEGKSQKNKFWYLKIWFGMKKRTNTEAL